MGDHGSLAQTARDIVARLRSHGHDAWLVGGCVRDELMGIAPKDYDVATSAPPAIVGALFPTANLVGAHFGVMLTGSVQIATYRSDSTYSDGRHPDSVTFETDPRRDAERRDFTINALFRDPFDGSVLDFFGGREDLRNGIIRAIGDPEARFSEDHLRMLRAIRFAARFGFHIEPATFEAIRNLRPQIRHVSVERIRDELVRILTEGGARRGMELLQESGLLAEILPEAGALQGVEQPPQFHPEGDVWTHVMIMLEKMGPASETLALGVLMHDIGKPGTFRITDRIRFDGHVELGMTTSREILGRLRFSNEVADRVESLVENHMKFKDLHRMKQSTIKRFLRQPHFDEHLELHRLDCESSNRQLESYEQARQLRQQLPEAELRPPRLINGHDLIALGATPGPRFSQVIRAVEDAQLENRIHTREDALALATRLFEQDSPQTGL